ncbi:MAG: hypothetical protein SVX43_16450 [Cyanobacteriota bacterium]|nr:hypothetical protein [Cyanobacteriota bacterium]
MTEGLKQAIAQLKTLPPDRQDAIAAKIVQKVEECDPWVKFAGMFEDDPLFDEFVEDMAAYRRELDAEVEKSEASSEENQSA